MSRKKSDYFDLMRKPTDGYIDTQLKETYDIFKQKSELKKPYLEKAFPEMEYQGYDWPDVRPYYPDHPPVEPPPHIIPPWYFFGCSLTCTPSIIRDCSRTYCCTINPAWQPIAKIELEGPGILTAQSKSGAGKGTGSKICFTLENYAQKGDHIIIKVTTRPAPGQEKWGSCKGSFAIDCFAECDCTVEDNVAYDTTNSDDTIDQNGTATVIVTDGCGPFSWSVTGTGFSIPSPTVGRTNVLSADNTACGTATITVTDVCGDSCTGYVRGTTGQWTLKVSDTCEMSGTGTEIDSGSGYWDYEYIVGNKKQYQRTTHSSTYNYAGPCPASECLSNGGPYECIGDGSHPIPCEDCPTGALPDRVCCNYASILWYYEWECVP